MKLLNSLPKHYQERRAGMKGDYYHANRRDRNKIPHIKTVATFTRYINNAVLTLSWVISGFQHHDDITS